jgi:hypothetical protein
MSIGRTDVTADALAELIDKQAITEVLHRYTRGVDRKDRATLESAYWPDAYDDHAGLFRGGAKELIDYILATVAPMRTMHFVSNVLIELAGESRAFAESYVSSHHVVDLGAGWRELVGAGRYLDRFEKRGGEWRIADRKVVIDIVRESEAQTDLPAFVGLEMRGGAYPDDPLYAMRDAISRMRS